MSVDNYNKRVDSISRFIFRGADALLLSHPLRTTIGMLAGACLKVLADFFEPSLSRMSWVEVEGHDLWKFLVLGVGLAHLRTIVEMIRTRPKFDESIEKAFSVIREAERQGVPKWRIREMYLEVCRMALANVHLKKENQKRVDVA